MKDKFLRETPGIAFNGLVERAGFDSIKPDKIGIQQNTLVAKGQNAKFWSIGLLAHNFAIFASNAVVERPGTNGISMIFPPALSTARRSSWFKVSKV